MDALNRDATQANPWRDFTGGEWQSKVDVRNFIQLNYKPFEGDASFLAPATARTQKLWDTLSELLKEERARGVLDVAADRGSSITAHDAGYIDQASEVIVGLQTDAPLKRAIMPNGGLRMVENGLEAFGFKLDRSSGRVDPLSQEPQPGRVRHLHPGHHGRA